MTRVLRLSKNFIMKLKSNKKRIVQLKSFLAFSLNQAAGLFAYLDKRRSLGLRP